MRASFSLFDKNNLSSVDNTDCDCHDDCDGDGDDPLRGLDRLSMHLDAIRVGLYDDGGLTSPFVHFSGGLIVGGLLLELMVLKLKEKC